MILATQLFSGTSKAAMFGWNGTNFRPIGIDESTRHTTTIAQAHAEIHEGRHFFCRDYTDLGNGGVSNILIVTPNINRQAHLTIEIEHELEASVEFARDWGASGNGVAMGAVNRDENSSTTPTVGIFSTPTLTTSGTTIERDRKGSGKKFGGGGRGEEEIILRTNTKYLLQITNRTANNNLVNWTIDWYEHLPKDA